MNIIRQEFCDETNTPMGLDNEFDYIRWLEAKIQALRIHNVSGCNADSEKLIECSNCGDKVEMIGGEFCPHCFC